MKKLFAIALLAAGLASAQTLQHSATLTWTDTVNPSGTTYNVYRATGLCSGTPTFSKLATAVTPKTYQDTTVTPGSYCFAVTAVFQGVESPMSNSVVANVPTFPPAQLSVV